ncbi:hypothetical protein CF60_15275 [Escherichia coli]|nr:hypothetical protein CF60_15275 [Escherichia coli]
MLKTIRKTRHYTGTICSGFLARGLPEQYSPGAIFRQEKAEIAAIRQEESAPQKPKRVSKRARLVWSAKKRLALNDIRAQPFNLQPKIKMRLLPLWRG